MKKIYFLILCLSLSAVSLYAQQIEFRRIMFPEGLSVKTKMEYVSAWNKPVVWYALQYIKSPDGSDTKYYLHFYTLSESESHHMPDGGKLLIKTKEGNIITLTDVGIESMVQPSTSSDWNGYMHRTKKYEANVDLVFKMSGYLVHSAFEVSEETLATLMHEGIRKMRVETNKGPFEIEYKDNKKAVETAKVITRMYEIINSQIDPYKNM